MRFYFNNKDNELVITYITANDEQAQIVIEPFGAIYTGMDSDVQFTDYPQELYKLKNWLESTIKTKGGK